VIYIPEIIGRVVDAMRKTGSYASWTNTAQVYTFEADNELTEGEWVLILDTLESHTAFELIFPIIFTDDLPDTIAADPAIFGMFQAVNVTSTSFDIISSSNPPVIGGYKSVEPFFMFGHRREISNRLLQKDRDEVYKFQKYPLFALRLPISETVTFDYLHEVELNLAILAFTQKNYRAQERYDNVIHPILMPLYFDFLEKIQNSGEIVGLGRPEHTKVDRLFYGVSELEGNEKYIFNDPLDGIELIDLNLKIIDNNCN
jgi:hypothetical protein